MHWSMYSYGGKFSLEWVTNLCNYWCIVLTSFIANMCSCVCVYRGRWEEAYMIDSPYQRSRKMVNTALDGHVKVQ